MLTRWAGDLSILIDAGAHCDRVAAALLRLLPGATAAQCQLNGATGSAGQAAGNFLTATVETEGRTRGRLAVATPERENAEALLSLAARLVALQLPAHEEEQGRMMELVTVGEAAGWVVHALNNHLNGMVLQAACVQMLTQPPVREQAEQIRREGARAAARLRPLQAVRPWPAHEGQRVNLVETVREVLCAEPAMTRTAPRLPAEEILIPASAMGLKRMLTLLFRVALRCVPRKEQMGLRVVKAESAELVLDLPGVRGEGEGEGLDRLPPDPREGLDQLEREAARWLVRQTGGRLEAAVGKDGMTLTIRWTE